MSLQNVPRVPDVLRARAVKYLSARDTYFADWDRRGQTMLVRARFGDFLQLLRVEQPLGLRNQITFAPYTVSGARYLTASYDNSVLLRVDRMGSNQSQLMRIDLLEGTTARVSDGKASHAAVRLSSGGLVAYASNARRAENFDVYVNRGLQVDGSKLVYRAKGVWHPLAFAADEKRLLLRRQISDEKNSLHLLDLGSGLARRIRLSKSDDAGAQIGTAVWSKDQKSIYLTSDHASSVKRLYRLELSSGKLTALTAQLPWPIEALALSVDGRTLAVNANAAGSSHLYLLDTRNERLKQVKLPYGIISKMRFSSRGVLGFSLSQPTQPANAYAYDPLRRKLTQWTRGEVGGLNPDFFVAPKLIRFSTFDKAGGQRRRIPAFYYKPPGAGPHAVVILLRGGPQQQYRPRYQGFVQYLLMETSVAVVAPNLRGSAGYGREFRELDDQSRRADVLKDLQRLLQWIKKRPELDAKRVAIWGDGAYGGYLGLCALKRLTGLRGVVDWMGIADLPTFVRQLPQAMQATARTEYGDPRRKRQRKFMDQLSPSKRLRSTKVPLLIVHGAKNRLVRIAQVESLLRRLTKRAPKKQRPWFVRLNTEGSRLRRQRNVVEAQLIALMFLERVFGS